MREGWQGWSTSCQRRGIPRWISWKQKKMKIHHTELDAAQNIIFFASLCTQSIFLHLASITWNLHHINPPKSSHFKMHITFLCMCTITQKQNARNQLLSSASLCKKWSHLPTIYMKFWWMPQVRHQFLASTCKNMSQTHAVPKMKQIKIFSFCGLQQHPFTLKQLAF